MFALQMEWSVKIIYGYSLSGSITGLKKYLNSAKVNSVTGIKRSEISEVLQDYLCFHCEYLFNIVKSRRELDCNFFRLLSKKGLRVVKYCDKLNRHARFFCSKGCIFAMKFLKSTYYINKL
jgi:hypothetical protein